MFGLILSLLTLTGVHKIQRRAFSATSLTRQWSGQVYTVYADVLIATQKSLFCPLSCPSISISQWIYFRELLKHFSLLDTWIISVEKCCQFIWKHKRFFKTFCYIFGAEGNSYRLKNVPTLKGPWEQKWNFYSSIERIYNIFFKEQHSHRWYISFFNVCVCVWREGDLC
jgi:hypothetical protein